MHRPARSFWRRSALVAATVLALGWGQAAAALATTSPGGAWPAGLPRPAAGERVLWALYTIGSDFEDDYAPENQVPDEQEQQGVLSPQGASSDDMREVVAALMAMPAAQRARVGVLVCFGGARKQGWRGSRVVDAELLLEDAQDGYFGNLPDARYLRRDPQANMAAPSTLAAFLALVKQEAAGAPVVLELAGHGQSYEGMGADTTQPKERQWMGLAELGQTVRDSGVRGPILAFSACTMMSLEVAKVLGDRFRYVVGSEETMGYMGWNYESTFALLGRSPAVPWAEVAKAYANSIVDDPGAAKEEDKTGSAIDLQAAQRVWPLLEAWSQAVLGGGAPARQALLGASRVAGAVGDGDEFPVGVDAESLMRTFAKRHAPLQAQSLALAEALKAATLTHRSDPSRAHALGWSIYPPHRPLGVGEEAVYSAALAPVPSYWRLVQALSEGRGRRYRGSLEGPR